MRRLYAYICSKIFMQAVKMAANINLLSSNNVVQYMTGRKMCALLVPSVVPYKVLVKLSKALYGTTGSTYSARVFRPVMLQRDLTLNVC